MEVQMHYRLQQGQLAVFTTKEGSGVQLKLPTNIFREIGEPQELVVGIGGFEEQEQDSDGSPGVEYFSTPSELDTDQGDSEDGEDGDGASGDVVAESGAEAASTEEEE